MPVLSLAVSAGPGGRVGASSGAVEEGGRGGKSHTKMGNPLL